MKLEKHLLPLTVTLSLAAITLPGAANAGKSYKDSQIIPVYASHTPHWYASANLGVSHLFDKKTPSSTNSVDQNGPGFNVNVGYQYTTMIGAEAGFNHYHNSRETTATTNVAQTEHYSAYLAGTGHYLLADKISVLGKLGVAYNYANKIYNAGPAAAADSINLYYGVGAAYSLTQTVDFVAQWARSLGDNSTGSADLYSLGLTFALT